MNSVLRVNNVSKKAKDFQILNKVSFELGSGEITGLIGPNGAGKTSIMKILVGLTRNYTGEVDLSGVRDIGSNVLCRIKRRGKKESRRIAGIVGP